MASSPRFILTEETAYIELLLRDLDANSKKNGLQRLCALYRSGSTLLNPAPLRTVITGLLNDESAKVQRWALNALALLGTVREANPILRSIDDFRSSPDNLGAAISALSVLMPPTDFDKALRSADLPLEGSILFAAAQQNDKFLPKLRTGRINIETASPVDLRMATILVGLGKTQFRLFSPHHTNASMIGELNSHDDPTVAQYSIWAVFENPNLGIGHLRLPLPELVGQPENVRGWVYRLIASDAATAEKHADIIQHGSVDPSVSARLGLAEGLVRTSFPGVDGIVLSWALRESSGAVQQHLLEHMARFASAFPRYEEMVIGVYRSAGHNTLARARLEAAARGTALYSNLKAIDLDAERADLFNFATDQNEPSRHPQAEPLTVTAPLPDRDQVRVLIVVALPKELAAVRGTMSRYESFGVADDPNVYAIGEFADPDGHLPPRAVLVCQSSMGNTNAATTAVDALRSFNKIEHIIMCGIAGGCPSPGSTEDHVRLGDIVFSSEKGIVEYDFVKEDDTGRSVRSSPQKPSKRMMAVISSMQAEDILGNRPWEAGIDSLVASFASFARPDDASDILHDAKGTVIAHPAGSERHDRPRLIGGAIATADTLQKNPEARDELRDKYGARAIEMEAGGMQNAAWARDRSIMVIRGICDYCDPKKNDVWQMYAAGVAAAFTRTLVLSLPQEWFPVVE